MNFMTVEEIRDVTCDACGREMVRSVSINVGGLGREIELFLCSRDRKRLAAMLMDRSTWVKGPPVKRGWIAST